MVLYAYKATDINISRVVDEKPDPTKFRMHTHGLSEILCVLSGEGIFHVEGSVYHVAAGDLVIMRPAEAHYIEINPDIPYERIIINFDSSILSSLDPDGALMAPFLDRKAGKQNLYRSKDFQSQDYMQHLQAIVHDQTGFRATTIANTILLLRQICIQFHTKQKASPEPDTVEYKIIRYINKNLHRELSILELCDTFFISKAQLCRRFKASTGTTVAKYIAAKRLLACRQLLSQGRKPTEIYSMYGYKEYSTFYRAYMKAFSQSPKEFPIDTPVPETGELRHIIE